MGTEAHLMNEEFELVVGDDGVDLYDDMIAPNPHAGNKDSDMPDSSGGGSPGGGNSPGLSMGSGITVAHSNAITVHGTTTPTHNHNNSISESPNSRDGHRDSGSGSGSVTPLRKYQAYVGNLTWWTSDKDIQDTVQEIGVNDFVEVKFYENRANGQSKGYCVLTVGSDASLRIIHDKLSKKELHGMNPVVTPPTKQALNNFEAQAKTRPTNTGSSGSGGSGSGTSGNSGPNPGMDMMGPRPGMQPHQQMGMYGSPGPSGPRGPRGMMMGPGPGGPPRGMGHIGPPPPGHPAHRGMPPNMHNPNFGGPPRMMQPGPNMPPGMPGPPPRGMGPMGMPDPYYQGPPMGPGPMPPMMDPRGMPPRGPMPGPGPRPDWQRPPGPDVNSYSPHGHGPPQQNNSPLPPGGPRGPPQQMGGPPPQQAPAPHMNPAFFHPAPGPGNGPYNNNPSGQYGGPVMEHRSTPPPSHMSDQEFDEVMSRNRTVSSSAISRAVADAAAGEFASAIETLVTAISLIKGSKVANDERCKILISSLQDTLHGIEAKSYERRDDERYIERSRSHERNPHHPPRGHRERSRSREYRDRSRDYHGGGGRSREYRDRSRERERYDYYPRERERSRSRDRGRDDREESFRRKPTSKTLYAK